MLITLVLSAWADPCCEIKDFAVAKQPVIIIDQHGNYDELIGGYTDSEWSLENPYTFRHLTLEGNRGGTVETACSTIDAPVIHGKVACWGAKTGTGTSDHVRPPDLDDQTDAPYSMLDLDENGACAIGSSGTVMVWGKDSDFENGPTGNGYLACEVFNSGASEFACAVGGRDGVECWGDNALNIFVRPPTDREYVDMSCRSFRECFAVGYDGSLYPFGQPGEPAYMAWVPNMPSDTDFVAVHVNHTGTPVGAAQHADGYVSLWQGDPISQATRALSDAPRQPSSTFDKDDLTVKTNVKFTHVKIEHDNICGIVAEDATSMSTTRLYDPTETLQQNIDAGRTVGPFLEGQLVCWARNGTATGAEAQPCGQ